MFVTVYAVCLYLEGNLRQIYPLYIGEKAAFMYGADYACNVLLSHLDLFLAVCRAHMENLSRSLSFTFRVPLLDTRICGQGNSTTQFLNVMRYFTLKFELDIRKNKLEHQHHFSLS